MLRASHCCQYIIALLLTYSFAGQANDKPLTEQEHKLLAVIKEASDYNLVRPTLALQTLTAHKTLLNQASEYHKYLYFQTGFWAAISLYDSEKIYFYLEKMFESRHFPNNELFFSELMYSFSLWYAVAQQYDSAVAAGLCALEFAKTDQELSRSTVSLGLTYLMTNNYDEAKRVFEINFAVSKTAKDPKYLSASHNNLALLHIFTQHYQQAEYHLRTALKLNEKMARANGTAINLANLLLVFYLQRDWQGLERLTKRAIRATKSLDNEDLKHYVFWLTSAFELKTSSVEPLQLTALLERYQQVQEPAIMKLIGVLAEDLNIELPSYRTNNLRQKINFTETFPSCNLENANNGSVNYAVKG